MSRFLFTQINAYIYMLIYACSFLTQLNGNRHIIICKFKGFHWHKHKIQHSILTDNNLQDMQIIVGGAHKKDDM